MSILKKLSADEEFKAEYEYWLKYEREKYLHGKKGFQEGLEVGKAEGIAEGEAKGEAKKAIEDVCTLITKYKVDIDTAMADLKLDPKYKTQVLEKLKELEG